MKNHYVGQKLIELRGEGSQSEVAAGAGVSRSYYCNVENNRRPASEQFLQRIADYYRLPISDLITLEEDNSPLSIAIAHIENPHDKDVVSSIAEDWKKMFREKCKYKHIGIDYGLILLFQDFGYNLNPERTKLNSAIHFEDENGYTFYNMHRSTCGLNIRGERYTYLDKEQLLGLQSELKICLDYLIYKFSKAKKDKTEEPVGSGTK